MIRAFKADVKSWLPKQLERDIAPVSPEFYLESLGCSFCHLFKKKKKSHLSPAKYEVVLKLGSSDISMNEFLHSKWSEN